MKAWLKKNLLTVIVTGSSLLTAYWQHLEKKWEHQARERAEREVRQWESYTATNQYE